MLDKVLARLTNIVSDFFLLTDVFFAITEQTYCAPVVDCGYFLFVELMGLFVCFLILECSVTPSSYLQTKSLRKVCGSVSSPSCEFKLFPPMM